MEDEGEWLVLCAARSASLAAYSSQFKATLQRSTPYRDPPKASQPALEGRAKS